MKNVRLCERCGEQIPSERLEVLPDTCLCVPCSEKVGSDYVISIRPENMAKTSSLKKNYGGWSVKKKRRKIIKVEEEEND